MGRELRHMLLSPSACDYSDLCQWEKFVKNTPLRVSTVRCIFNSLLLLMLDILHPLIYFSKAIFEGVIFGGAYIRRGLSTEEICVSKSIGLAL